MMFPSYSGECFDVAQQVAVILTDEDRTAGREAPAFGYSSQNFNRASAAIQQGSGPVSVQSVYQIARGL